MTNTIHLKPAELNALRRRAVQLRIEGRTLASIRDETGLSHPTIIAAYKAYCTGGWQAVDTGRRGRPASSGTAAFPDNAADLMRVLNADADHASAPFWSIEALAARFAVGEADPNEAESLRRRLAAQLRRLGILQPALADAYRSSATDAPRAWMANIYPTLQQQVRSAGSSILWLGECTLPAGSSAKTQAVIYAHTTRGTQYWQMVHGWPRISDWLSFLSNLLTHVDGKPILLCPNPQLAKAPEIRNWLEDRREACQLIVLPPEPPAAGSQTSFTQSTAVITRNPSMTLTHLQRLEAESIHIMREVVAEADNPVMLYSIGKDSAVMLHLARKAFFPAVPPFPLLHVDTRWKFRDMYAFRDRMAAESGMDLLVHVNPEGIDKDINPFTHGSAIHTDIMKTEALKQALDKYGFDAAFGGARRDEEKSRAKERVFSFRSAQHRWDPKNQRPELWKLYNARKHKGESIRIFPLSNWTELDIWQYIHLENIPIVPLYYAAARPVVERDGTLIMVDDERMPLKAGEVPMMKKVRFRTLGCYPLTGAIESQADTLPAIIQEMLLTRTSERQGRVIDHDSAASMEKKKQEGYF